MSPQPASTARGLGDYPSPMPDSFITTTCEQCNRGFNVANPLVELDGPRATRRTVNVAAGDEPFEWTVPCEELVPTEPVFPPTPVGFEIVGCWCLTLHTDHGLAVESVELRSER